MQTNLSNVQSRNSNWRSSSTQNDWETGFRGFEADLVDNENNISNVTKEVNVSVCVFLFVKVKN